MLAEMVIKHYFRHCLLHVISMSGLDVNANAKTAEHQRATLQIITLSSLNFAFSFVIFKHF